MNRRRIFDAFVQGIHPVPPSDDWIPLAEAATALQALERGSDRDRMVSGLGGDAEAQLAYWAFRVAEIGVTVHGCRIGATKFEVVSEASLRAGTIRDHATRLEVDPKEPLNDLGALQVHEHEVQAALARLAAERDTAGPPGRTT